MQRNKPNNTTIGAISNSKPVTKVIAFAKNKRIGSIINRMNVVLIKGSTSQAYL